MASLQVQLIDTNRELVHVDPVNHALLVTSADGGSSGAGGSWAIDNGISFTAGVADKIGSGQRSYLRIQAGANALYATFTWTGEDIAQVYVRKDPTVSAESAATAVNRNGESATTSLATVTVPTTVSSIGTAVWTSLVPPGGGKDSQQFILEPNSDYLILIEDISGTTQFFGMNIDFYEPDLT